MALPILGAQEVSNILQSIAQKTGDSSISVIYADIARHNAQTNRFRSVGDIDIFSTTNGDMIHSKISELHGPGRYRVTLCHQDTKNPISKMGGIELRPYVYVVEGEPRNGDNEVDTRQQEETFETLKRDELKQIELLRLQGLKISISILVNES